MQLLSYCSHNTQTYTKHIHNDRRLAAEELGTAVVVQPDAVQVHKECPYILVTVVGSKPTSNTSHTLLLFVPSLNNGLLSEDGGSATNRQQNLGTLHTYDTVKKARSAPHPHCACVL